MENVAGGDQTLAHKVQSMQLPYKNYQSAGEILGDYRKVEKDTPLRQDGIDVPGLGTLPSSLGKRYERFARDPGHSSNQPTVNALFGYNLPYTAGYMANVERPVQPALDQQYGNVIDAIQEVLGTRTNPTVWDGKVTTEKAIWDKWITFVKKLLVEDYYKRSKFMSKGREADEDKEVPTVTDYDSRQALFLDAKTNAVKRRLRGRVINLGNSLIDVKVFFNKNIVIPVEAPIELVVEVGINISYDEIRLVPRDSILSLIRQYTESGPAQNPFAELPEGDDFYDDTYVQYIAAYIRVLNHFPHLVGKLALVEGGQQTQGYGETFVYLLKLRSFTGNIKDMQWSFSARYGPFDQIFKMVGSFAKSFISLKYLQDPDGALDNAVKESMAKQVISLYDKCGKDTPAMNAGAFTFEFLNWMFIVGRTNIDSFGANVKSFTRTYIGQNGQDYIGYLVCLHTLAKWYSGKKKQLTGIQQQRVQNYLEMDKRNLDKVFQFFGTNLPDKKIKK